MKAGVGVKPESSGSRGFWPPVVSVWVGGEPSVERVLMPRGAAVRGQGSAASSSVRSPDASGCWFPGAITPAVALPGDAGKCGFGTRCA